MDSKLTVESKCVVRQLAPRKPWESRCNASWGWGTGEGHQGSRATVVLIPEGALIISRLNLHRWADLFKGTRME